MAKIKKSPQDEERDFKRIKEQKKPIKNFKSHLKDYALNYMNEEESELDDEDSIYNRERS